MSLTRKARLFYPDNRRLAARWVLAARYLRSRRLWIIDQGSQRPTWGNGPAEPAPYSHERVAA